MLFLPSMVSNIITWHGVAALQLELSSEGQLRSFRAATAGSGAQGGTWTRWKMILLGKNAALWPRSAFVTALLSRVPDGATEQAIPRLGVTGRDLKVGGEILEKKWLRPCPKPTGRRRLLRGEGQGLR